MKTPQSTSKVAKPKVKKLHIGILAAVFVTLISAVSLAAFNAFAAPLPEEYENVQISGIYYCGLGSKETRDVSQIRIGNVQYQETADISEAKYVEYPSLPVKINKIDALDASGNNQAYTGSSFELDLADLGKISPTDGIDILSYLNSKNSVTMGYYSYPAGYMGLYKNENEVRTGNTSVAKFVLTLTDGSTVDVNSLNVKTIYPALINQLGYEDNAKYYVVGFEVIRTYDLKQSTSIKNTSFLIGGVTVPLKTKTNDEGEKVYLAPDYQAVFSDGSESSVYENMYMKTLAISTNTIMIFSASQYGGTNVCTPGNALNYSLSLQYGAYGYRTILPSRMEFNYYTKDEGVVDSNTPPLEEDSRTSPVYSNPEALLDYSGAVSGYGVFTKASGFVINDGGKVSKEGYFLDKWILTDKSGNPITDDEGNYVSSARPGETLYFNYVAGTTGTGGTGREYYQLYSGYSFEGIDPNTGELRYSYTAKPVFRNQSNLRYELNLSEVYSCYDKDGYAIIYGRDTDYFYDENNYELTDYATVTSDTYTSSSYTFVGWSKDKAIISLLKKTDDGNYIDAYNNVYEASSFLTAGDTVLMDRDHTLYAVWRISDAQQDNFIRVRAKVTNGKFVAGGVYSGCRENYGNWICNIGSDLWLNSVGESYKFESYKFINKVSTLNFLSVPNEGYDGYKLKYHLGDTTYSVGYGENEIPVCAGYDGHCDHFQQPLQNASTSETYYYEIEYFDSSSCDIYFYDNNPSLNTESGKFYSDGSVSYNAYGLWNNKEYALSQWSVPQGDGSVKLNGVGVKGYTTTYTWTPAPDAQFNFDGYYFAGWAKASYVYPHYAYDPDSLVDKIDFASSSQISLVAVWKEIPNVIYYSDTDKATAIDTQPQTPGFEINVGLSQGITAPTKEHYQLAGWECVTTGVTVNDGKFTMPDGKVEFVPVWEINKNNVIYTVENAPAGYTKPATEAVAYGDNVTVAGVPSVTGYDFTGWECTTSGVTVTDGKFTMPDSEVNFKGTFTIKSFNLNYYDNIDNSSPIATQSKQYNSTFTLSEGITLPTREGHNLKGWNTSTDGQGTSYAINAEMTMPADDVDLYAVWEEKTYQLAYDKNTTDTVENMPANAENLKYSQVKNGYALNTSTVPTRTGCTFTGWKVGSVDNASKAEFSDFNNSEFKAVAAAQWQENTYTVIYNANSPTGSDSDVSEIPANESALYSRLVAGYVLSGSPKCDGYTFKGWSKTAGGAVVDKVYISDLPSNSTSVNVYAIWETQVVPPTTVDVVYRSGFTSSNPNDVWQGEYTFTVEINQPYKLLDNQWFSREGYSSRGWVITNADGLTGSMTAFFARLLGASSVGSIVQAGDSITLDGPLYLAVNWVENQYHVTYDANGATSGTVPTDSNDYALSETAMVKDKGSLAKDGAVFLNWNTEPNGNGTAYAPNAQIVMTTDVTLYAIWKADPSESLYYTLKYNANGATSGSAPQDDTRYHGGESVTVAEKGKLAKTDCTFKEWNTKANGKGTGYKEKAVFTMPSSDVTLYAIWVDSEGNIVSPGTGENALGITIAIAALIVSMIAGACVTVVIIKKRRLEKLSIR